MSATPSSASATAQPLGEEKNLLLIDTGAAASCCGGGRCGTGIDSVDASTTDGSAERRDATD